MCKHNRFICVYNRFICEHNRFICVSAIYLNMRAHMYLQVSTIDIYVSTILSTICEHNRFIQSCKDTPM